MSGKTAISIVGAAVNLLIAVSLSGFSGCKEDENARGSDPRQAQAPSPAPKEQAEDLRGIIEAGIETGAGEIVVPPGRYRVTPKHREHLKLRNLENIRIIADGVEMICTETTRAITIENCKNLTIRGLAIDYDPLPYTQGRITGIEDGGSRLEVEILRGYPEPGSTTGTVEIFDPSTARLRGRITHYGVRCEPSGPLRAVLTKSKSSGPSGEKIGDIALIRASFAPGGEIPHAIMATDSEGLSFENVSLYASNCFGFFENRCSGSSYKGCRVDRRAPEQDLAQREIPRLRSLNADAFHSKHARRGPSYENCVARFMADDGIAINGDFHFVAGSEGASLRVLAKHEMTMRPGDEVQIFTYDGKRPDNRKIVSIEADAPTTEEERLLIRDQEMDRTLQKTAMTKAFRVVLDQEVQLPAGTLICSADRIGDGFSISGCHLGDNRSRGILVKAGHGKIHGNEIRGAEGTAILVSPEFWWMEAGLSDELDISDNLVADCGGMGIAVVAVGGDRSLAPSGAFRDITLKNNTITGGAAPGLLITSVRGLEESGNTVSVDAAKSLFSWEVGAWGNGGIQPVMKIHVE